MSNYQKIIQMYLVVLSRVKKKKKKKVKKIKRNNLRNKNHQLKQKKQNLSIIKKAMTKPALKLI